MRFIKVPTVRLTIIVAVLLFVAHFSWAMTASHPMNHPMVAAKSTVQKTTAQRATSRPVLQVTPSPNKGFQKGEVGQHYDEGIRVQNGKAPFRFEVISGKLPPGLFLSEKGTIHGMPDKRGNFTFTVRIKDSADRLQDVKYTIHIGPAD